MEIAAIIKGDKEVIKSLANAAGKIDSKELLGDYMVAARDLRDDMKRRVPFGKGHIKWSKPLGRSGGRIGSGRIYHLRDAILAKRYKKQQKGNPAVYVMVSNHLAPHRRIVEWGTGPRYNIKWTGSLGRSGGRTGTGSGAYRGVMPAKQYFRPAIDDNRGTIEKYIEDQTWKRIQEAFK